MLCTSSGTPQASQALEAFAEVLAEAPVPLDADAVAARITNEVSRETDSTLATLPGPAEP